jgi:hypothetical protein
VLFVIRLCTKNSLCPKTRGELAVSQITTHIACIWRDNTKLEETLRVEIEARKYILTCFSISNEILEKLFTLLLSTAMTHCPSRLHIFHTCFLADEF